MGLSPQLLKKIAEARASAGGNNILDGRYILEVHRLLVDQKFKGTMFIAEFGVVKSEPMIADVKPNAPGTTCSTAANLDTNVSAPGNMKAIILALLNKNEDEISSEALAAEINRLVDTSQPARGMLVGLETYRKTIQTGPNAGKPFVGYKWHHIQQSPAEVAERRWAIDHRIVGGISPKQGASAAQAVSPVAVADLEMDTSYVVDGRLMTFAGSSRGSYYFNEGGDRRTFDAGFLEGKVFQLAI